MSNLRSTSDAVIFSHNSFINLMQNISISNINTAGIILDLSNITEISLFSLMNMDKGMIIQSNSAILNLFNSSFVKLGSSNILYGGAIDIIDSILNITN